MKILQLIDRLPILPLAVVAFFLAMAPIKPEPHLWEKLKMLADGTLVRPLDIFDLLMHSVPLLVFVVRAYRGVTRG